MREDPGTLSTAEEDESRRILEHVLKDIEAPAGCAIVLEGSIAEGFGNDSSDYDISIITDSDVPLPIARTVLYYGTRRAEIYYRPMERVRQLAGKVNACAADDEAAALRLTHNELENYQRLANSATLTDRPLLQEMRALFDRGHAASLNRLRFAAKARQYFGKSLALLELQGDLLAVAFARSAVECAAKAWAAAHGESYLSWKFLSLQLERLDAPVEIVDRVYECISPSTAPSDPAGFVDQCESTIRTLGIELERESALRFEVPAGVETWTIADRVYLLRGDDLDALSMAGSGVWQQLQSDPGSLDLSDTATCSTLLELHRRGLLVFETPIGGERWVEEIGVQPDAWSPSFVSVRGVSWEEPGPAGPHVRRLPIPALHFVETGGHIVWRRLLLENRSEDAGGALRQSSWRLLEIVLRARVTDACALLLLGTGRSLPERFEAEALFEELRSVDPDFAALASELAFLTVARAEDAPAAIEAVEGLVELLPGPVRSVELDGLTDALEPYQQWLKIAFEWMPLAHRLSARLPLPEAADLMNFFFGGEQPRLKVNDDDD